jgi:hypothetical protein
VGLLPSDDTFIDAGSPATSHGAEATFEVLPDNVAGRRSLLKFDLSSIPSNVVVTGASLYLYELGNAPGQVTYIHRLTSDWDEDTATWQRWASPGGDFDSSTAYFAYLTDQNNCMLTLDITRLVNAWVTGAHPNYGLLLLSSGPDQTISYASKENETTDRQPRLNVTYTVP